MRAAAIFPRQVLGTKLKMTYFFIVGHCFSSKAKYCPIAVSAPSIDTWTPGLGSGIGISSFSGFFGAGNAFTLAALILGDFLSGSSQRILRNGADEKNVIKI